MANQVHGSATRFDPQRIDYRRVTFLDLFTKRKTPFPILITLISIRYLMTHIMPLVPTLLRELKVAKMLHPVIKTPRPPAHLPRYFLTIPRFRHFDLLLHTLSILLDIRI